jgi:hypothetical protein
MHQQEERKGHKIKFFEIYISGECSVVDPDPVGLAPFCRIRTRYPFQPKLKVNFTFSRKFQYPVQNSENSDTYDSDGRC